MHKVILLDDEPWVLRGIENSFDWGKMNYEIVATSTNPLEVLELASQLSPDLIITDIKMPFMSGIELIEKLQSTGLDCEFIIVSGFADFHFAQEAINLHVLTYILKPIEIDVVIPTLQNISKKISEKKKQNAYITHMDNLLECTDNYSSNHIFKNILEYINANFSSKDINLHSLAEHFNINATYICDLFKKSLGKTYNEYLTELRIGKACSLLVNTELPIYTIADQVGYTTYYFNTIFKKRIHQTPLKYRQEYSK